MKTVQLAEIAEHPREILDRARQSPILLEEDGEALAVVLSPTAYEAIVEDRRRALERYVMTFRAEMEKGCERPFKDPSPAPTLP